MKKIILTLMIATATIISGCKKEEPIVKCPTIVSKYINEKGEHIITLTNGTSHVIADVKLFNKMELGEYNCL